jgi:uncharacterized protein (UPF0261 family)
MGVVVLIGTLDTKGREYQYVRECLAAAGAEAILIDVGVLSDPAVVPDISAAQVAAAAGSAIEELRFTREGSDTRAVALEMMRKGALAIVRDLLAEGRCDAVLGAAGSGGSTVISGVMRELPLGLPKLLVTTFASGAQSFFGTRDLTLMHAVTDIAGLNRFSRTILANAAHAVVGMIARLPPEEPAAKPTVAITMFGVTTPGVLRVQDRLHEAGFETIVFHAVGSGGRAMEQMVDEGLIDGVVDYTTSELTDELLGGVFSAGPTRLTAAGRRGIPQVVVPGAIEVLNFGPRDTVPPAFDTPERRLVVHNPYVSAVRTLKPEAVELARIISRRLQESVGPIAVLIPTMGFDSYQRRPDGPFIDEEADQAFCNELRRTLRPDIAQLELALNINDPAFADHVAETFLELWRARRSQEASP